MSVDRTDQQKIRIAVIGIALLALLFGLAVNVQRLPLIGGGTTYRAEFTDAAGLVPGEIGHVNAHGTATTLNDLAEGRTLAKVFGPRAVPVTSVKGTIGHLMGGAGAVEAVATVLAMNDGLVPPTANCDEIDPAIELDVVRGGGRSIDVAPAVSCSFGFGGQNAAVTFAPA